jgi:hypothetical protein
MSDEMSLTVLARFRATSGACGRTTVPQEWISLWGTGWGRTGNLPGRASSYSSGSRNVARPPALLGRRLRLSADAATTPGPALSRGYPWVARHGLAGAPDTEPIGRGRAAGRSSVRGTAP